MQYAGRAGVFSLAIKHCDVLCYAGKGGCCDSMQFVDDQAMQRWQCAV